MISLSPLEPLSDTLLSNMRSSNSVCFNGSLIVSARMDLEMDEFRLEVEPGTRISPGSELPFHWKAVVRHLYEHAHYVEILSLSMSTVIQIYLIFCPHHIYQT